MRLACTRSARVRSALPRFVSWRFAPLWRALLRFVALMSAPLSFAKLRSHWLTFALSRPLFADRDNPVLSEVGRLRFGLVLGEGDVAADRNVAFRLLCSTIRARSEL